MIFTMAEKRTTVVTVAQLQPVDSNLNPFSGSSNFPLRLGRKECNLLLKYADASSHKPK